MAEAQLVVNGDTLRLAGKLTFDNAPAIARDGERQIRRINFPKYKVNLADLTQCNSAALAILLCWLRTATDSHKQLAFEDIPSTLSALIELSGLADLIH